MPYRNNLLLNALQPVELKALSSGLVAAEMKQHDILHDVHELVTSVYFPFNAAVSLVIPLSGGEVVETAMVGRDGAVGVAAALDGRVAVNRAVVQLTGSGMKCT